MRRHTRSGGHCSGLLWIEGGGLLGQFLELATQLLELPDAPIEVGGVAPEQVGDMGAGCLAVVADGVGIGSVA